MFELDPNQQAQVAGAACIERDMSIGAAIGYWLAGQAGAVAGAAAGAVYHVLAH